MTNEELLKKALPDYAQYSEPMSRSEIELLLNEARLDERSKVIGEIEEAVKKLQWDYLFVLMTEPHTLGFPETLNPLDEFQSKLNEMKNVRIQKEEK